MNGKPVEERVGVVLVNLHAWLHSEGRGMLIVEGLGNGADEYNLVFESLSALIPRIVLDESVDEKLFNGENHVGSRCATVINKFEVLLHRFASELCDSGGENRVQSSACDRWANPLSFISEVLRFTLRMTPSVSGS